MRYAIAEILGPQQGDGIDRPSLQNEVFFLSGFYLLLVAKKVFLRGGLLRLGPVMDKFQFHWRRCVRKASSGLEVGLYIIL